MELRDFSLDLFSLEGRTAVVTGGNTGLGQAFTARARDVPAPMSSSRASPTTTAPRGHSSRSRAPLCVPRGRHHAAGHPGPRRRRLRKTSSAARHPGQQCRHLPPRRGARVRTRQWDPTVAVNLTAAFEMSHEAAKRMIPRRRGKIVNICSVFTFLGGRLSPAYASTKHGIAGLTKAYCDELAEHNIQVNGIAPGYYATAITAGDAERPRFEPPRARAHSGRPLGRAGRPHGRARLPREPGLGLRQRPRPLRRRRLPRPLEATCTGPYVIGVDCGTQSAKVVVYDVAGSAVARRPARAPADEQAAARRRGAPGRRRLGRRRLGVPAGDRRAPRATPRSPRSASAGFAAARPSCARTAPSRSR